MVPGRCRRLRAEAERVRRAPRKSEPRSASPAITIWSCSGKISLATFGGEAGAAAAWTREVLDAPSRAFLTTLAPSAVTTGAELFHGSPRDPVWDYVLTEDAAR